MNSYNEKPTKVQREWGTTWVLANKNPHREDGPAVIWNDGREDWYIDGKLHRIGGPAIKYASGDKTWYIDGQIHREDGPASTSSYFGNSWYLNDVLYTKEDFKREMIKRNLEKLKI